MRHSEITSEKTVMANRPEFCFLTMTIATIMYLPKFE